MPGPAIVVDAGVHAWSGLLDPPMLVQASSDLYSGNYLSDISVWLQEGNLIMLSSILILHPMSSLTSTCTILLTLVPTKSVLTFSAKYAVNLANMWCRCIMTNQTRKTNAMCLTILFVVSCQHHLQHTNYQQSPQARTIFCCLFL